MNQEEVKEFNSLLNEDDLKSVNSISFSNNAKLTTKSAFVKDSCVIHVSGKP